MCNSLPGHATIAVASKGDPDLVAVGGRRAAHVPAGANGDYAGYHPRSSDDAICELGDPLRSYDHFVLPATSAWWLDHYAGLREHLRREWIDLGAPRELGRVFCRKMDAASIQFVCNVCGFENLADPAAVDRDTPSCGGCGSTGRWRAVVAALLQELTGERLPLAACPKQPDLTGIGLSDWDGYAERLRERFAYENTFLDHEPRLDVTVEQPAREGTLDFIVASDVFEYVHGPIDHAFGNVRRMLRPGGVVVLTTPYAVEGHTQEWAHATRDASVAGQQPLRLFSLPDLIDSLHAVGFVDVVVHEHVYPDHGILWSPPISMPVAARAPR